MKKTFLLCSKTAKKLYNAVKGLPIIDYHNHLSLDAIKTNQRFIDIYDLWIKPDPYKHRAMRMCGVSEVYITGDATNKEKFIKWCETLPRLVGNPLYIWSLMELEQIFGVTDAPNHDNAVEIYDFCNQYLAEHPITAEGLLDDFGVEYAAPCASIADDLSVFEKSRRFAPSLRGDDIVNPTMDLVQKLETVTGITINRLDAFQSAIGKRLDAFVDVGCKFSDHALDDGFVFYEDDGKNEERFAACLLGNLESDETKRLSSYLLGFLGQEYAKRGLVMQLHIGALRYTSTRLRNLAGPAGGFAGIGNSVCASSLTKFLDWLEQSQNGLPKTVLFTLNPADNALISVLSGSYSKDGVSGLVTQGPAWWWCDHQFGMEEMLEHTAAFGVLSNFIGMTTDSRSFLSFVRHDYFRRILCNWLAEKMKSGAFECSEKQLEQLGFDLCYGNAKKHIQTK